MKKEDQINLFSRIWFRFNANMGSLYIFSQEISNFAEDWDSEFVHKMAVEIADLLDQDSEEVEKQIFDFAGSPSESEVEPYFLDNATVREVLDAWQSSDFKRELLEWCALNPDKAYRLTDIFNSSYEQPPANGILIRRSILITLAGFLEQFFQDIFYAYYKIEAERNLARDKKKKVTGLLYDEIWINDQVDKAMKGNLVKTGPKGFRGRIESLKYLGIDLAPSDRFIDEIQEITQRRNLFVHQDGIIDQDYIDRLPASYKVGKALILKRRLLVSTFYINRAMRVVYIFGLILHNICWRMWIRNGRRQRNEEFGKCVFSALKQHRYDLVEDLYGVASALYLERETWHTIKINYGIVLRERGQIAQLRALIGSFRNLEKSWKIKLALSILQENFESARMLLNEANDRGEIGTISKDWPLFEPIRNERWFLSSFEIDRGKLPSKSR